MPKKRRWVPLLLAFIGLVGGTSLGLWYGWMVDPVEYTDTDIAYLHPLYKEDLILMVSKAYALDGDLDTARARLALLALPAPAESVADLAERQIALGAPPPQVRVLAELADALGARRDTFAPYLPVEERP